MLSVCDLLSLAGFRTKFKSFHDIAMARLSVQLSSQDTQDSDRQLRLCVETMKPRLRHLIQTGGSEQYAGEVEGCGICLFMYNSDRTGSMVCMQAQFSLPFCIFTTKQTYFPTIQGRKSVPLSAHCDSRVNELQHKVVKKKITLSGGCPVQLSDVHDDAKLAS